MMAVVIIVVVVAVLAFGLLIFWLMRRAQREVPGFTEARAAQQTRGVATDERCGASTDADEPAAAPRDQAAFADLLQDEIHDRGLEQPRADDES